MFKGFGRFGGMGAMAAGAFAAAVLALGAWIGSKRGAPEEAAREAVAVLPERDVTPEDATLVPNAVQGVSVSPEGDAATEPEAAPQAPAFDEVRRESDGMTVIAGRAAPGSTVAVLKDGEEIATATADGAGKFATLAMIPPDGKGHVLTLLGQDGEAKLASEEEIILTPTAAPVQMAEADITPEENPLGVMDEVGEEGAAQAVAPAGGPEAIDAVAAGEPVGPTSADDGAGQKEVTTDTEPTTAQPEQATPLAGTATAEGGGAEESQPAFDSGAAAQEADEDRSQPELEETETVGDTASTEQDPATNDGEGGTPSEATPMSDTGTVDTERTTSEQERSSDPAPSVATPMAGTDTADDESAATPEQDGVVVQGEDTTNPAPSQATPMAGTGTADDGAAAPSEPNDPAEQSGDLGTEAAPAQAMPMAETGTDDGDSAAQDPDGETPSQAAPLAETGTAETDADTPAQTRPLEAETEAPSLAERTAPKPDTTTPAPAEEPDTAAAPAIPPAPAPVLKSTAEGVERLDTAPPQVMTNVALDTIGYSDQGDVQLAGRAQPETSEVRVYLNNNAVISLPVDQEGRWRGDLPDVDEGVYTLRVDELSRGGDVTSRVETPFKRESPEVLAAATEGLTGPLSAVTVQKGDTLWAISRTRYGDPLLYVKVFEANSANIRDPDLIYPGQVFDLPEDPASE
ncbi:LysM peptidoglycan-binding domain-containing protein [Sulfitobacter sp. 1A12056]|uniref:LysM peptidoglycan-binding domain-containing protein n=1 Tax=Sulfitobacter sp. 1A12056 TaxID=3368592 RepID=UPI003745BA1E